jgi:hypothetical protein
MKLQAGGDVYVALLEAPVALAGVDHGRGEGRGPGAGAGNDDIVVGVSFLEPFHQAGAAQQRSEPQLVAAGKQEPGRPFHDFQVTRVSGVLAGPHVEYFHPVDAQLLEYFPVILAHLFGNGRSRRENRH